MNPEDSDALLKIALDETNAESHNDWCDIETCLGTEDIPRARCEQQLIWALAQALLRAEADLASAKEENDRLRQDRDKWLEEAGTPADVLLKALQYDSAQSSLAEARKALEEIADYMPGHEHVDDRDALENLMAGLARRALSSISPERSAPCAECSHDYGAHTYGKTCIGNRNLCRCQQFVSISPAKGSADA